MKLGIVESEPVSQTLRKRTNADKALIGQVFYEVKT